MSLSPWRGWNKVVDGVYVYLLHGGKPGFDRGVREASSSKAVQDIEPHVLVAYIKKDARVPLHSHNVCQTTIVVDGEFAFQVDGKDYVLTKGRGIVVPSGAKHAAYAVSDVMLLEVKSRGCYKVGLLEAAQTLHLPPYKVSIVHRKNIVWRMVATDTREHEHLYCGFYNKSWAIRVIG